MTAPASDLPAVAAPRVFSGMQPSGGLTLGNYLGAMVNWIEMQKSHDCLYCIVDLHAITTWQEPQALRASTRELTAAYMACGLDTAKSIIFNQSQVAAHAELSWIFNCVARLGWLNRMTQFKEKAGKDRERASAGLYIYPNLMAADILAYRATHVPVGDDQKQHLELSRDIAQKFNGDFADDIATAGFTEGFFPLPEPIITGPATRVMSLRDGTKKMSKSDPSDLSRINLTDDADAIATKFRKAKSDADALPSEPAGLEGRAEAQNLVGIYAALTQRPVAEALADVAGGPFSALKSKLADAAVARLQPISQEMGRLLDDHAAIDAVLKDGAERADAIATPIVDQVKDIVGFVRSR
ncbi:MAG: tryptophan--tRNA ligase [Pseudomonadota bacterium]